MREKHFEQAIYYDNLETFKKLLQIDSQLANFENSNGSRALHLSAGAGALRILKYLVNNLHQDVNLCDNRPEKSTPLHWATNNLKTNTIDFLLAQPTININKLNAHKASVLDLAYSYRSGYEDEKKFKEINKKCLEKLIYAGASIVSIRYNKEGKIYREVQQIYEDLKKQTEPVILKAMRKVSNCPEEVGRIISDYFL